MHATELIDGQVVIVMIVGVVLFYIVYRWIFKKK